MAYPALSEPFPLTTRTLGMGTRVALGSDGTGDIYYRGADGLLHRLAAGSAGQVLTMQGGVPTWTAADLSGVDGVFSGGVYFTNNAGEQDPLAGSTGLYSGADGKLYLVKADGTTVGIEERPFPPGTVVAAGDSISANAPNMHSFLVNLPAFDGSTVVVSALGGWDLDDIESVYAAQVYPHRPAETGMPGYLFVRIGTNDFQTPGLVPADYVADLEAYWQNAKDDGFIVFAHTISGRAGEDSIPFSYSVTARYEINNLIRKSTVWDYLVDVATIFPTLGDADTYPDGVHPSPAANETLAMMVDAMCSSGTIPHTTDERLIGESAGNLIVRNASGGITSRVGNVTNMVESTAGSGGRNVVVMSYTDWSSGVNGGMLIRAGGFDMLLVRDDAVVVGRAAQLTELDGNVTLGTVPTNYADNAAAIAGGLGLGRLYRNGDALNVVH